MRRALVFCSLLTMLGAVAGMGALRERPEFVPVVASAEAEVEGRAEADAPAGDGEGSGTAAEEARPAEGEPVVVAGKDAEASDVGPSRASLSVVALGWEILAPGVLANAGTKPGEDSRFHAAGLDVTFASVTDPAEIEVRLGRGGDDKRGADIALMPLPAFVASYERLRALSPKVFFVVGWSRGRDALIGDPELLRRPPRSEVRLIGRPGASETLVGLFALDQAGVSPRRVKLVEPKAGSSSRRGLRAVQRRRSRELDARELILSTADATHLVPIVAVAPAGVVERERGALVTWSHVWLGGAQTLSEDPAAAARQLAGQSGAPEAVDLIDALGWLEFVDLPTAAQAAGLSGRSAVNLDALFHRTWELWREVGLLTTPPPERVPLTATIIADLALQSTPAPAPAPRRAPGSGSATVLLTHAIPGRRLDAAAESALVAEVGLLAGVFSRSTIEVWIPRSPPASDRVTHHARARFGLDEDRVITRPGRDPKSRKAAVIQVQTAR